MKKTIIEKENMVSILDECNSISDMAKKLGHCRKYLTRWTKLYTVFERGKEKTIYTILRERSYKSKYPKRKKLTESQIKNVAVECISMSQISRKLGMQYQTFYKSIRTMRDSKTNELLIDVVKDIVSVNLKNAYRR